MEPRQVSRLLAPAVIGLLIVGCASISVQHPRLEPDPGRTSDDGVREIVFRQLMQGHSGSSFCLAASTAAFGEDGPGNGEAVELTDQFFRRFMDINVPVHPVSACTIEDRPGFDPKRSRVFDPQGKRALLLTVGKIVRLSEQEFVVHARTYCGYLCGAGYVCRVTVGTAEKVPRATCNRAWIS